MSTTTTQEKSSIAQADVHILLEQLKSAAEQPRVHLFNFFEDLRHQIDIGCQSAMSKTNQGRMLDHQETLIAKVNEFERLCFADMPEQTRGKDWQLTLGQIEVDLKRPDISESELNSINRRLSSDDLLQIEKVLFQDRCMFFVKADINKWGAYSDEGTKCKKALWVHAFL